ncbi:fatty acyl-AMP ligase [Desulfoprunum benzoelyticum]|uniref:Fatty-acyl-CoA synthase n=1 Tax=Desulfoprunum benzoelyticum TaxID=1506996 RepID=A0A840USC1_9BACT|nr:fatty acyl-AMP ligase [Desulfoprunum benzoelyticum]MBB5348692.1 fatty-acyl-CoA synthase [Desulfoprunum benzoelyticum]MBM9530030.1 fatty acyl-AMP ligase [Desulfoprunum benzoelyticum]
MKATPTTHDLPLLFKGFSTLADALDYAAQGDTGYNFYSGQGKLYATLPYAKLRGDALTLAKKLLSLDLPRGTRVAIVADTHPDFVRFFFACQYAGFTPVPLPATIQLSGQQEYTNQLQRLLSICQAEIAIANDDFLPFLIEAAARQNIRFAGNSQTFENLPESSAPLQPLRADELAYLQYTSGSTRFPRGVMISQEAVLSNTRLIIQHGVQVRDGDRAMSWLPFYHDMGLVGLLLTPLVCQISVDYLNTRHFAMRPRLWLKIMSENRATISFSPPFGYDLAARRLRDDDLAGYDLRHWRVAGVGAEMIHTEALAFFADRLQPSGFDAHAFLPCYGMAECALAVCFGQLGAGVQVDRVDAEQLASHQKALAIDPEVENCAPRAKVFTNCGSLLPGYVLEIRDEQGRILPERQCGTLFVRGPSVMSGYFGNPEATREVLSPDGWLNTGDIAYLAGANVVIIGRSKDVIIINGRNILPQDIEYLAESQPEIRTGDATAFPVPNPQMSDQAVLLVECRENDEQKRQDLIKKINQLVRAELGIDCIIELVARNTLIRTTSGKPSRHSTRNDYLQNMLQLNPATS